MIIDDKNLGQIHFLLKTFKVLYKRCKFEKTLQIVKKKTMIQFHQMIEM